MRPTRIFPLGDNALTVEFGSDMSEEPNDAALGLASYFERNRFTGFVESVPAVASVTIFYDLQMVRSNCTDHCSAFEHVKHLVEQAAARRFRAPTINSRLIEVPVSFREQDAPDLLFVAETAGLTRDEVVDIFLSSEYRVYMLGFLPGFAYMGTVDQRIMMPRKSSPRLAVPKGSVALAGRQTGIYPTASPGGWQLIGRTGLELIREDDASPCIFQPGDRVRFTDAYK